MGGVTRCSSFAYVKASFVPLPRQRFALPRLTRDSSSNQCLIRLSEGLLRLGEPEAYSFLRSLASPRRICLFALANHFASAKQCLWAGYAFLLILPSFLLTLLSIPTKHKQMRD